MFLQALHGSVHPENCRAERCVGRKRSKSVLKRVIFFFKEGRKDKTSRRVRKR